MVELYCKNFNERLKELAILHNSFNIRSLFLIIEYLLAKKIFLRKKEHIIQIYKTILILDKNNIININDILDMNNIIEIKNYFFPNEDRENDNFSHRNMGVDIKLKDSKDIMIKTNLLSKREYQELNDSIKMNITSNLSIIPLKFDYGKNYIVDNVSEIRIKFRRTNIKNDFIINIIPIKNKKLLSSYLDNKDKKILSLIEKSFIQYLLFLFEDINTYIKNIIKKE